ncbi:MAG: delta-lactam-biosynthetic de-N-acetylase [Epulopiscium sp.]|nr:delta-lactam-biosynthetic de-N-acetylase [Candidatus Epulonipiscium sp.]
MVEDEESAKKQEKEELEEKPEPETVEKPKEETKEAPKETSKEEQKPVEKPAQETSSLPNDKKSWWFKRNSDHLPPGAQSEIDIAKYDAYYLGNTKEKKIYLTFDEGYENGYTPKILDVLKEHNVKAAFFVTKPYIQSQPDLVKRMVEEGHIVGNHSVTHPSLPDKTDEEVKHEILETARYFEEVTSTSMPLFFRPPAGEYSERTLQITKDLGYKTIFWSMAYKDWDVNNQPGKQAAYEHIVQNHHPGAIILLHAVSSSNTEALGDMLKYLRDQGYTFASLNEL